MDHLLQNTSIDTAKKLIACENAFHICSSYEKAPITNGDSSENKKLSSSVTNLRHCGMERIALAWLMKQLDHEIKPPTSIYDKDSFILEIKERSELWSCLTKICKWYPAISEKVLISLKPQPCEFMVKSIVEGMDGNTSKETRIEIFQWIIKFVLQSEKLGCALFRQPLSYNQAIGKLITVSRRSTESELIKLLDVRFILEHYQKFLKQIHDNVTDGGYLDIDSIEGNFIEIILPVLIDEDTSKISVNHSSFIDNQHASVWNETISEILHSILFKREQLITDWKDFLYSLTVPDRKPCPSTDHIEKLLYFLRQNTSDNNRVLKLLPIILKAILQTGTKGTQQEEINNATRFTNKEIVLFFIMCGYILKTGPLPTSLPSQIILDTSLAACKISGIIDEKSHAEDRLVVFGILINILSNYTLSSSIVSVEFNTNKDDNLESSIQFLMWLKLSLKDMLETKKCEDGPVEKCCLNTYSKTKVISTMMKLDSRIVESLIGSIIGRVLFKKMNECPNAHVTPRNKKKKMISSSNECRELITCQIAKTEFITELYQTYSKLRQIPKLIAKLFLSLQFKDDKGNGLQIATKVYPYSSLNAFNNEDLKVCGSHFSKLPSAQLMELFKTFLYHLESIETSLVKASLLSQKDLKSEYYVSILNLANQLIPCFFENSTMSDHAIPIAIKEKFIQLMIKMHDIIKSKFDPHFDLVKDVILSLSQLASLMMCYDSFNGSLELKLGLQKITMEAKIFDKDVKLGDKLSLGSKRKCITIHTNDKKRKRKSLDSSKTSGISVELVPLQNDILESIDCFNDDDYFNLAKLIWQSHANGDHSSSVGSSRPWLKTLISENVPLQNAVLRVAIETFAHYFEDRNIVPKKVKTAFQYLHCHDPNIIEAAQILGDVSFELLKYSGDPELVMKEEDVEAFVKIFGQLFPLELTKGPSESSLSLLLCLLLIIASTTRNIEFQKYVVASLLRCWDTTYRTTNLLRYVPFGKLLRLVCRLEVSMNLDKELHPEILERMFYERVPLTLQLSKIGISLQSSSAKANPLLDLNDGTIDAICDAVTTFFSGKYEDNAKWNDKSLMRSDTLCSVALMRSIESAVLTTMQFNKSSNPKMLQDEKSKQISYFNLLGKNYLLGLQHIDRLNHEKIAKYVVNVNEDPSSNNIVNFEKMTVMICGISANMSLKSMLPSLDLAVIENSLMNLVKFALKFVSSVLERTQKKENNANLSDIKQCFHFLITVCKHVSISNMDKYDNNVKIVLLIWETLLDEKALELSEDNSDAISIMVEQHQNELFYTILTNFKDKDLFRDIVTTLLQKFETKIISSDNRGGFHRLLNIVGHLATISIDLDNERTNSESLKNYEVRQTVLEKAIELIQVIKHV